ncbi:MAG: type II secretion system protein [Candidatus Saccharimonadales bacterium]
MKRQPHTEKHMPPRNVSRRGFTIVELLIVIVVIGVLAAITVIAFSGIQNKARDSGRLADMKTIIKALETYKTNNGIYPDEVSTLNAGGWEVSNSVAGPTNFLAALVSPSGISRVPLDPRNTVDQSGAVNSLSASWSGINYVYFYYRYPAGNSGCDVAKGEFYVLGVARMDTVAAGTSHPSSPGFSCSGRNWASSGAWVTGSYTNG